MRILLDLDGIVADLLTPWISWCNSAFKLNSKIDDIVDWDMHKNPVFLSAGLAVYDFLNLSDIFTQLLPLPGAIDAIKKLQDDGNEILIVSAASRSPATAADKLIWVQKHLNMSRKQVFLCHRKELIKADLIIDDNPKNLIAYRKEWPRSKIATLAYPYNKMVKSIWMAMVGNDWSELLPQILNCEKI